MPFSPLCGQYNPSYTSLQLSMGNTIPVVTPLQLSVSQAYKYAYLSYEAVRVETMLTWEEVEAAGQQREAAAGTLVLGLHECKPARSHTHTHTHTNMLMNATYLLRYPFS